MATNRDRSTLIHSDLRLITVALLQQEPYFWKPTSAIWTLSNELSGRGIPYRLHSMGTNENFLLACLGSKSNIGQVSSNI
jgi:hypothetical protein